MIKKYNNILKNTSDGAEMIIKSAKKRRIMALSEAKSINSETGLKNKLVAVK